MLTTNGSNIKSSIHVLSLFCCYSHNTDELALFDWFKYYYLTPWCRAGPYVIGLALGKILYEIKRPDAKPVKMHPVSHYCHHTTIIYERKDNNFWNNNLSSPRVTFSWIGWVKLPVFAIKLCEFNYILNTCLETFGILRNFCC